jgi:hypothetical protein
MRRTSQLNNGLLCVSVAHLSHLRIQYRANVFTAKVWLVRRSLKFDEMVLSIQDDLHSFSIFVQVDQTANLYSCFVFSYVTFVCEPVITRFYITNDRLRKVEEITVDKSRNG